MSAKLIMFSQYYNNSRSYKNKDGSYSKGSSINTGMMNYIATREGVELNEESTPSFILDENSKYVPMTNNQKDLLDTIIKDIPEIKEMEEYEIWNNDQSLYNSSKLIDATVEFAFEMTMDTSTYMKYIGERPGVVKNDDSSHGLFSSMDAINLNEYLNKIESHKGNVWTHIISLRREDAIDVEYDNQESWKRMLRANISKISEQMNIPMESLEWCAAFHDEGHHPHVHLMMWSNDKFGYLDVDGIKGIKSVIANDIFAEQLDMLKEVKNDYKDELKLQFENLFKQINGDIDLQTMYEKDIIELAKMMKFHEKRNYYGYQPTEIKNKIDSIVEKILSSDSFKPLVEEYVGLHEEHLQYYKADVSDEVEQFRTRLHHPRKSDWNQLHQQVIQVAYKYHLKNHNIQEEQPVEYYDSSQYEFINNHYSSENLNYDFNIDDSFSSETINEDELSDILKQNEKSNQKYINSLLTPARNELIGSLDDSIKELYFSAIDRIENQDTYLLDKNSLEYEFLELYRSVPSYCYNYEQLNLYQKDQFNHLFNKFVDRELIYNYIVPYYATKNKFIDDLPEEKIDKLINSFLLSKDSNFAKQKLFEAINNVSVKRSNLSQPYMHHVKVKQLYHEVNESNHFKLKELLDSKQICGHVITSINKADGETIDLVSNKFIVETDRKIKISQLPIPMIYQNIALNYNIDLHPSKTDKLLSYYESYNKYLLKELREMARMIFINNTQEKDGIEEQLLRRWQVNQLFVDMAVNQILGEAKQYRSYKNSEFISKSQYQKYSEIVHNEKDFSNTFLRNLHDTYKNKLINEYDTIIHSNNGELDLKKNIYQYQSRTKENIEKIVQMENIHSKDSEIIELLNQPIKDLNQNQNIHFDTKKYQNAVMATHSTTLREYLLKIYDHKIDYENVSSTNLAQSKDRALTDIIRKTFDFTAGEELNNYLKIRLLENDLSPREQNQYKMGLKNEWLDKLEQSLHYTTTNMIYQINNYKYALLNDTEEYSDYIAIIYHAINDNKTDDNILLVSPNFEEYPNIKYQDKETNLFQYSMEYSPNVTDIQDKKYPLDISKWQIDPIIQRYKIISKAEEYRRYVVNQITPYAKLSMLHGTYQNHSEEQLIDKTYQFIREITSADDYSIATAMNRSSSMFENAKEYDNTITLTYRELDNMIKDFNIEDVSAPFILKDLNKDIENYALELYNDALNQNGEIYSYLQEIQKLKNSGSYETEEQIEFLTSKICKSLQNGNYDKINKYIDIRVQQINIEMEIPESAKDYVRQGITKDLFSRESITNQFKYMSQQLVYQYGLKHNDYQLDDYYSNLFESIMSKMSKVTFEVIDDVFTQNTVDMLTGYTYLNYIVNKNKTMDDIQKDLENLIEKAPESITKESKQLYVSEIMNNLQEQKDLYQKYHNQIVLSKAMMTSLKEGFGIRNNHNNMLRSSLFKIGRLFIGQKNRDESIQALIYRQRLLQEEINKRNIDITNAISREEAQRNGL